MKNKPDDFVMVFLLSLVMHAVMIYFFCFGLPKFNRNLPEEQIIITEILPISNQSNVKNQKNSSKSNQKVEGGKSSTSQPREDKIEEKSEKEVKEIKKIENPIQEKNDKVKEPEKIKEKKQENKKETKETKKKEQKQEKNNLKEKEENKKKNKKEPNSKEKKKKPKIDEFDSLLQNLEQTSKINDEKVKNDKSEDTEDSSLSKGSFNSDNELSITEYQAIKSQIEEVWNVPIGIKGASDITVTLYIALNIDGTVTKVYLVDKNCSSTGERECSAAIDSAIRAVNMASPFQNLSSARYSYWKEFRFEFNPNDVAN